MPVLHMPFEKMTSDLDPVRLGDLSITRARPLAAALPEGTKAADNVYLKEKLKNYQDFNDIVGDSAPLRAALARVGQVAQANSSVLLLGPTGTGKELFARAIHERSRRHARPLVRVNCAALPPTLVESELFGHEKGVFTGAVGMRQGRFEIADGGTIFLDEIGDLPHDIQVKFLRVLQSRRRAIQARPRRPVEADGHDASTKKVPMGTHAACGM